MQFSAGVVRQSEINAAVSEIVKAMAPDVVHIRFNFGQDWSGDDAIFFRVLLSDNVTESRLYELADRVREQLSQRLDFSSLGLFAYHNFRTASEQAVLREEAWA